MTGFGDLNLKFSLILAISVHVFMSSFNFILRWVEHEKSFITSESYNRVTPPKDAGRMAKGTADPDETAP